MKIRVSDLSASDREIRFEIGLDRLSEATKGRSDIFCTSPGLARLFVSRIGSTVNMRGTVLNGTNNLFEVPGTV